MAVVVGPDRISLEPIGRLIAAAILCPPGASVGAAAVGTVEAAAVAGGGELYCCGGATVA